MPSAVNCEAEKDFVISSQYMIRSLGAITDQVGNVHGGMCDGFGGSSNDVMGTVRVAIQTQSPFGGYWNTTLCCRSSNDCSSNVELKASYADLIGHWGLQCNGESSRGSILAEKPKVGEVGTSHHVSTSERRCS